MPIEDGEGIFLHISITFSDDSILFTHVNLTEIVKIVHLCDGEIDWCRPMDL